LYHDACKFQNYNSIPFRCRNYFKNNNLID
jgi:hypothetical protein